jgi:uncharacterized membrane protein
VTRTRRPLTHLLFDVGVVAKGIDGILEIAGGVLLLFVKPGAIGHLARLLTQHELSEDPRDLVARFVLQTALRLTANTQLFAAIYLLGHGVIKVVLVAGLLLRRRRDYPVAMGVFFLFVVYQLYRYSHTHAPTLLALSALDVFVIALTWVEYKRLRASREL